MKFSRIMYMLTIGCIVAISPTNGAIAQQEKATAQENTAGLEEVIVTAQKRDENLQDIGLSITALDATTIDRAGIVDISRIELVTPGMTYGFIGSDAKVSIRGANSNNTYADNASIAGVFIDGVYLSRAAQQRLGYFDVKRIEVLKGPQGTLYGRNTFAGAINIYTNQPNLDAIEAGVDLTLARFGMQRIEGYYNVPASDQLAVRFAGATEKSDGWVKNIGAGGDAGIYDNQSFRISALWAATDDLQITARYTGMKEGGTSLGVWSAEEMCYPVNELYGMSDPLGTGISCATNGRGLLGQDQSVNTTPWTINNNGDTDRNVTSDSGVVEVNWDLNSVALKSITSYSVFDSLYTGLGQGGTYYWTEDNDSFTQELTAVSTYESALQWTAGVYYSHDKLYTGYSQFITGETAPYTETRTDAVGNVILVPTNTARIDLYGGGNFSDYNEFQTVNSDVAAAFTQAQWSLTDTFRLIGGVRYNSEKKDNSVISGTSGMTAADAPFNWNSTFPPSKLTFPNPPYATSQQTFTKVTWRAGFDWTVSDNSMIYATSSNGFLSGGMNGNGTFYDQQDSLAFEVGYKSRWLDNRLQFNASIYHNDYTNLTAQKLIDADGDGYLDLTVTENGGDTTTTGLEFELTWLATEKLTITGNGSFMDSKYGEFGIVNPFLLYDGIKASEVNNGFIDLHGGTPPWSPKVTLSLTASYNIDMGSKGELTPYLLMYYSDGYNTDDVSIYSTQYQPSYTKTDFRLIWAAPGDQWTVSAFVENIENADVLARTNTNNPQNVTGSYIYPRNYGLKVSFRY